MGTSIEPAPPRESAGAAALRLLTTAVFTIIGFVVVVVGVILLVNGVGSNKMGSAAAGAVLILGVLAYVVRAYRRSRRLVEGSPTDPQMVCRACGVFPATELVTIRPSNRAIWLWRTIGTTLIAAGAAGFWWGNQYALVAAAIAAHVGFHAWRFSAKSTMNCPKCAGTSVARSTSDAGRRYLQTHSKQD